LHADLHEFLRAFPVRIDPIIQPTRRLKEKEPDDYANLSSHARKKIKALLGSCCLERRRVVFF
jgi:hypothetical protein